MEVFSLSSYQLPPSSKNLLHCISVHNKYMLAHVFYRNFWCPHFTLSFDLFMHERRTISHFLAKLTPSVFVKAFESWWNCTGVYCSKSILPHIYHKQKMVNPLTTSDPACARRCSDSVASEATQLAATCGRKIIIRNKIIRQSGAGILDVYFN